MLVAWTCSPGAARAYCRTTTDKEPADTCDGECDTTGYPLAWPASTITYIFQERGFPDLDDASLREAYAGSFGQWQAVSCAGEEIGLDIQAAPDTTDLWVRPETDEPTTNVIGHLTAGEWSEENFDPLAFALTRVRFDANSGRIMGADTWFNGGLGHFEVCPAQGCSAFDDSVDLPNVATHEAGHLLGLSHSGVKGATMACSADPTETEKRSLEQDDRDGLCAIYPPDIAFRSDYLKGAWTEPTSPRKGQRSCSVTQAGADASWRWAAPLLVLLTARGLRRRRRQ